MYRLAIIDDEFEQVRGIKDFIDWEKYDIQVCGVAYNGRDGLELLTRLSPDIAIIDIQMPYLNGLNLIEEINAAGLHIQMIILSGHDNFEYACKAIQLKANNYLLKPCSVEEILQAVLRAKNLANEDKVKQTMVNDYHSLFQAQKTSLKENLLVSLLEDSLRKPDAFFEDAAQYDIHLTRETCCSAVIRFLDIDSIYETNTLEEFDHLVLSVLAQIRQHIRALSHCEVIYYRDSFVLIASGEESNDLLSLMQTLYSSLCDQYTFDFSAGIGQTVASPLLASVSFHQALTALESGVFLGLEAVTVFEPSMLKDHYQHFYPFKQEQKILSLIEAGDKSLARAYIDDFFQTFEGGLSGDCMFTKKIGITLLSNIFKYCADRNIDFAEINALIYQKFDEINAAKTLATLKEALISTLKDIISAISDHTQVNHLIKAAIDYIHVHYRENINLQTAASELFITPAYLSVLFKQETKENFINYLNDYRLEQSKKLLKDISKKNYQVAYETGFQDEKYFYKLFKKNTGLTPNQYRDSLFVSLKK